MKKRLLAIFSLCVLTGVLAFSNFNFNHIILPDDMVPGGGIASYGTGPITYVSHLDSTPIFTPQSSTGPYSSTNCAPTSLYMILKWLGLAPPSVSQLRNALTGSSGWIYTPAIEDYLSSNVIPYQTIFLNSPTTFLNTLTDGILLLCLDISKITAASTLTPPTNLSPLIQTLPVGKESSSGTGHFIVATGYFLQDAKTYIEVLDPLNSGIRYYELAELHNATKDWYNYLYLFTK